MKRTIARRFESRRVGVGADVEGTASIGEWTAGEMLNVGFYCVVVAGGTFFLSAMAFPPRFGA